MVDKAIRYLGVFLLSVLIAACGSDEPATEDIGDLSLTFYASNLSPACEELINLKVSTEDGSTMKTVDWVLDGQSIGQGESFVYTFHEEGVFNISVQVTDEKGRSATISQTFTVKGMSLRYALTHFDSDEVWIMGHRGNSGLDKPENSVAGVESCIALNGVVNVVEIDPRMTKDGVIILMHDETIDRTTTGTGKVKDLTYEEIKSHKLKLQDGTITDYSVATLQDVLAVGKGKIYFDLDMKNVSVKAVYDLVKSCGMLDQVFFYSEDLEMIQTISGYSPAPIIYPQCIEASDLEVLTSVPDIKLVQLSLSKTLDSTLPETIIEKGLLPATNMLDMKGYSYDSQMKNGDYTGVDKILKKNVNMIQTDYPQLLDKYLKQQGKK